MGTSLKFDSHPVKVCLKNILWICLLGWGSGVYGQSGEAWIQERDSILDASNSLLRQGQFEASEQGLLDLMPKVEAHQDTAGVISVYKILINIHLNEEAIADSLLDLFYPLVKSHGKPSDYVEYYIDRANVLKMRGDFVQQITFVDSGLTIARSINDSLNMGFCYFELASAYQNVNNFPASLEMSQLAGEVFSQLKQPYYQAFALRSTGVCYEGLGKLDSSNIALEASSTAFLAQKNESQAAFNDAIMGRNLLKMEEFDLAVNKLEAAHDVLFVKNASPENDVIFNQVRTWMAEAYLNVDEHEKAQRVMQKAVEINEALGETFIEPEILETLLKVRLHHQPQNLQYFYDYVIANKRFYKEENANTVLEYEQKYKVEEARRKVEEGRRKVLELDQIAKEALIRNQENRFLFVLILSIILVLGLIAAFLILRARFKTRQQLDSLNRKALQLQINPHFFFNVLNSINHYITENDQKAAHYYLARFARLMRLSLENSRFEEAPLGQELDILEAYLELEKLRMDRFEFSIDCPENLRSLDLPPLMLQPFVENAVVHAFPKSLPHRGLIEIIIVQKMSFLEIQIQDNGIGFQERSVDSDPEEKSSLAIQILKERLALHRKQKGDIVFSPGIESTPGYPGTHVLVRIPLS